MAALLTRIARFFEVNEITRGDVLRILLAASTTYAALVYLLTALDPQASKRRSEKGKRKANLRRIADKAPHGKQLLQGLTEYEQSVASEIVLADEINVSFDDIGGLDDVIDDLRESVILPLTLPELFQSTTGLLGAPKGVLLYGPPGCGKTMLAKALASNSGATFINMHISTLTDKWFGESNKLVNALFSLARKLQPSIVFIDEIDAFLRERERSDHEAMAMIKAEFMSLWDGLASEEAGKNGASAPSRILVLGATNRPEDIDSAILRRMPKRFHVKLPDAGQRRKILKLVLRDATISETDFDMDTIVRLTAGQSGSGIKELCRTAAMRPVREFIREHGTAAKSMVDSADTDDTGGGSVDSGIGRSAAGSIDMNRLLKAKEAGLVKVRPLRTKDFMDEATHAMLSGASTERNELPTQAGLD